MFPFLNNSKCLPNIRRLKFQRCSDAVSKRNQSFSNRSCPETMPARISVGGSEGIFSTTEGRGQLISHSSLAWLSFSNTWYLLWSNHGCFILLSVFPVFDYLLSFISSSQLHGLLVADTWQFIWMKDASQGVGHGLDHSSVYSVCVDSQEVTSGALWSTWVRAELRLCCRRLCPLGSWEPPRWWPLLGSFLLHPKRLHWGLIPGDSVRWVWPE